MRSIHAVRQHETFVASGAYEHEGANGQRLDVTELWSIHQLPDGARLVRVDVERQRGQVILCEAWVGTDGKIAHCDFLSYAGGQRYDARYLFSENAVEGGAPDSTRRVSLPVGYVVCPLLTVFEGLVIPALLTALCPVVRLGNWFGCEQLQVKTLFAAPTGTQPFELDGHSHTARVIESNYTMFWLDEHHIPLQVVAMAGWRIKLTRYAHRRETSGG